MRCLVLAFAGWLLLLAETHAAATARPLTRILLSGREYVSLAAWAKTQDLVVRTNAKSDLLLVTNRSTRLAFVRDSRRLEVNGVTVWMSFPVTPRNGDHFVSRLDVDRLLTPILSPPRNPKGQRVRVIVLDPGHGGRDPGNQEGTRQEKTYTLLLAREVQTLLRGQGLKVVMTRTNDATLELDDRPAFARRHRANLFVSLHYNAVPRTREPVRGVEVYCLTPAGAYSTNAGGEFGDTRRVTGNANDARNVLLAYQLQKALLHGVGAEDRGLKRARFAVLRGATMPAAMVEAGFMSDPQEAAKLYDAKYRRDLARAVVDGIMAYKRQVER